MLERGRRSMPYDLARLAVDTLHASPTAHPLRTQAFETPAESEKLSLQLAALGYPGFVHLQAKARRNPAEVLLTTLNAADLDNRVTEGLPWLARAYAYMDWDWVVRNAKDLKHLAHPIPLDLKILKERYEKELRWQLGNPEREDLTLKLWTEMIEEAIS